MYETSAAGMELQKFMKEKNLNPIKNFAPMFVQIPIFISMFVGLRGMCNLPVESLSTSGLFWFSDLTVADPYYLLPLCTSLSMFLQFKFAADGANLNQLGPIAKNVMMCMPFVLFPMTMGFPAVNQTSKTFVFAINISLI